jgi:hypothetical protein
MVQLQDSILECLHCHTLSSMLSDRTSEVHRVWILSCSSSRVGTWFITWLIFPTFWLSSPIFYTTFCTWLGLSHLSIVGIPRCAHPIELMGIHFLRCAHNNEHIKAHGVIHDTFAPLHEMLVSMWDENNYMHFFQPHSTPLVNESTLCSPNMIFAPWSTLLLSTHCKWIYFPSLA